MIKIHSNVRAILAIGYGFMAVSAFASEREKMNPPAPYKLECLGYGNNVVFANMGNGPVPAGTTIKWRTSATANLPARSGQYTFVSSLAPQMSVQTNPAQPASAASNTAIPLGAYPLPGGGFEGRTLTVEPYMGADWRFYARHEKIEDENPATASPLPCRCDPRFSPSSLLRSFDGR